MQTVNAVREIVSMLYDMRSMTTNVPRSEIGIATIGTSAARHSPNETRIIMHHANGRR